MSNFDPNNAWRKVSSSIYQKPVDGRIMGSVELDVTELEEWVNEKRRQGLKITLMYPLILAFARGLKYEVPELNCYLSRGKLIHREHVDVQVSVLMRGNTEMGMLRVPDADAMSISDLADFMGKSLQKSRNSDLDSSTRSKNTLASLPWPLRHWVIRFIYFWVVKLGLPLPYSSLKPGTFGSFVFSNIGSVGLDIGYPALLPLSDIAMVLIMGSISTKPAVYNGQVVPRRLLNLSVTLDHRVVDAQHGGKLFRYIKSLLSRPQDLE